MEDEVAQLVESIESHADALKRLGSELTSDGTTRLSPEEAQAFRSEARALYRKVESAQRGISRLAKRCEAASVESSEITALRGVSVGIAGELGSLAAIIDLASGELPGWGNPNKTENEIGADILRAARDLRPLAVQLGRVRAMKSPKRFAVGVFVRVRMPGVDGIVTELDDERSALSEYWHTIKTESGERREPGCNLELIEPAITHASPAVMKIAENITFHGHNSRITVNGNDNSSNTVLTDTDELFEKLREKAALIENDEGRAIIIARIDEMQRSRSSGGFLDAYKAFMASLSDHITVFASLLPALTRLLGIN